MPENTQQGQRADSLEILRENSPIRFDSCGGSMTVRQAIEELSEDRVKSLLEGWPTFEEQIDREIRRAWNGGKPVVDLREHTALCTLMQAGSGLVSAAVGKDGEEERELWKPWTG